MKAIRVHKTGGIEQLKLEEIPVPQPAENEILVKIHAAGVNFIDIYHRTGLYPLPLPFVPGLEAAGTVEAVGAGVNDFSVGDRVAYSTQLGAYAEYAVVPAEKVVSVPDGVSLTDAAAVMLQGMTAHYLTHSTYPLQAGETALIHAAAGGVGLLLVQLAKKIGATVIGTVSTAEKEALAKNAGADYIIRYTETDFETETMRLTDGRGVDVVYDSVGQATFNKSLNVLRSRGYMVLFGQSSGPVPPFDLGELNRKGSLFITRPSLFHYIAVRKDLLWRAGDLFNWLNEGSLKLR
ncbi:MAG TPA: quinone oxidoreductase, partial [Anaerolineae bacterium]|nr:quinone oxidoreductase [Anaerolineae bacterium]